MPKLRDEMIAKGLIQPQESFREKATVLERRYEAASERLKNQRESANPNRAPDPGKVVKSPFKLRLESIRKETEAKVAPLAFNLPLTKKQESLLQSLTSGKLTHEEREKVQREYNANRQRQELHWKKSEKKRQAKLLTAASVAAAASKKRKSLKGKLWIVEPSKGSSLFGGVKYSYVSVWQGGLPGLGKRK